jgi:hypothetical protein
MCLEEKCRRFIMLFTVLPPYQAASARRFMIYHRLEWTHIVLEFFRRTLTKLATAVNVGMIDLHNVWKNEPMDATLHFTGIAL